MPCLSYIYWNTDPVMLHLGPFAIRWYGLLFALGFYIGFFMVRWMYRLEHKKEADLTSLLVWMMAAGIIGARLGHCLFYEPGYYLKYPVEILAVWQGGLASHGGAAGILIALYFYCRKRPDQPYLWLLDRIVVPTALAGSMIRLGNLFNSEILGDPATVPWAFVFERVDTIPRHPAQLYESIAYLLVFAGMVLLYRRGRAQTPHGFLLGVFLVNVFTLRFFIEFFKQRQAAYEQNLPLSVGQWLSIPFVIGGGLLVWRALAKRPIQLASGSPEPPSTTPR